MRPVRLFLPIVQNSTRYSQAQCITTRHTDNECSVSVAEQAADRSDASIKSCARYSTYRYQEAHAGPTLFGGALCDLLFSVALHTIPRSIDEI